MKGIFIQKYQAAQYAQYPPACFSVCISIGTGFWNTKESNELPSEIKEEAAKIVLRSAHLLERAGNRRREGLWKPVVDAVRNRLSKWNNRRLSIGGIIVLLNSVLYALPVYLLSFFKAPSGRESSRGISLVQKFIGSGK
ncbi:transmembrane protein, putative [Medicago truncatula]|uniref:Transmembrane protein, putative n=1 Tax=Medicago truncatula TaxID=3880 RepID=A0A072U8T8_MEDTR|nr:transmembrane protein, putative [Medicago truncatula]